MEDVPKKKQIMSEDKGMKAKPKVAVDLKGLDIESYLLLIDGEWTLKQCFFEDYLTRYIKAGHFGSISEVKALLSSAIHYVETNDSRNLSNLFVKSRKRVPFPTVKEEGNWYQFFVNSPSPYYKEKIGAEKNWLRCISKRFANYARISSETFNFQQFLPIFTFYMLLLFKRKKEEVVQPLLRKIAEDFQTLVFGTSREINIQLETSSSRDISHQGIEVTIGHTSGCDPSNLLSLSDKIKTVVNKRTQASNELEMASKEYHNNLKRCSESAEKFLECLKIAIDCREDYKNLSQMVGLAESSGECEDLVTEFEFDKVMLFPDLETMRRIKSVAPDCFKRFKNTLTEIEASSEQDSELGTDIK